MAAKAEIFELNNGTIQAKISNFGCIITSLCVPDKDGRVLIIPFYCFCKLIGKNILKDWIFIFVWFLGFVVCREIG